MAGKKGDPKTTGLDPDELKPDKPGKDHVEGPEVVPPYQGPRVEIEQAKHIEVSFCRTLKPGMSGADVVAHKRALSRALPKVYPWYAFTDFYGPLFEQAVKTLQGAHAIPQSGVIGTATHTAMENLARWGSPAENAFDARAVSIAHDFCIDYGKTPVERAREAAVAAWLYWYSKRYASAYSNARPFWLGHPPDFPPRADCSGFYTAGCYAGGLTDPNQRGYDGQGYTGTLQVTGMRVANLDDLLPGDAIFYGHSHGERGFNPGDPTHVAAYVGHGMVVSDGHYPMGYYPFNYGEASFFNHMRHYDFGVIASRAAAMDDA